MQLENLKFVGDKHLKLLNKLNIYTLNDLLSFYPYKFNFIKFKTINEIDEKENSYIEVLVIKEAKVSFIKSNFNRLSFQALFDNEVINVTIFNRAFLKQHITLNKKIVLYGKYNKLKKVFTAADIRFNMPNNTIEAIYHLTDGLKRANLIKIMDEALKQNFNVEDKVPSYINEKYNLLSKNEAIINIHKASSPKEIKDAKIKLIYEEIFEFMFKINYLKIKNKSSKGISRKLDENIINNFKENLLYTPTIDQEKSFIDIFKDMADNKKMNRLVLGDVGSGKTLVAMFAIYVNYLSNHQTAFMAPTEILATQHYNSLKESLKSFNINVELLTGKMTKKQKEKIKEKLINQEIDLLIGTHSIISDDVIFKNLGLVITDEQHRFGVMQRKNLENKGENPDILYLSATPIPRTYALILYGDADVSVIKTKPKGRKEVLTKIVKEENIVEVLTKVKEELDNDKQVFIVSPLIENENESTLNSVKELKEKFERAFKNQTIEVIHGALKQDKKDKVMTSFANKEIDILISTTVIEVGIDVPNATVMVIYNAERFGLATLHQLRGRVGRGNNEGYCYLVSDNNSKRLKVLEESNDGFYITEKDYEERKEGDLFGTKQSGDMVFKIANLKTDIEIVLQAQKDSEEFITNKYYQEDIYYTNLVNKINEHL